MKQTSSILYVWVPLGLGSGVGSEGSTLIYHLMVIVAAWLMLEKILARRDWRGAPRVIENNPPRRRRRTK